MKKMDMCLLFKYFFFCFGVVSISFVRPHFSRDFPFTIPFLAIYLCSVFLPHFSSFFLLSLFLLARAEECEGPRQYSVYTGGIV